MKLPFGIWIGLLCIALLSTSGCNKTQRDDDDETVASHDNALAETLFTDLFKQVHKIAVLDTLLNDTGLIQDLDICIDSAILSDTLPNFPLDLEVFFGVTNSICLDGRNRRGKIEATFTKRVKSSFGKITIVPKSYFVDEIKMTGVMTIENIGFAENGNRQYVVEVENGRLEGDDVAIDWNSTTAWQWSGGAGTDDDTTDDEWRIISGGASGRNTKGNTFVSDLTVPQRFSTDCNWLTGGELKLNVPNLAPRTVNYGSGACDNLISVTRNATTYSVTLE